MYNAILIHPGERERAGIRYLLDSAIEVKWVEFESHAGASEWIE
jgi:hypothetical protein